MNGVLRNVGATPLTFTRCFAHSIANALVSWTTPPLLEQLSAHKAHLRTDVDDLALALVNHHLAHFLGAKEQTFQVYVRKAIPMVLGYL